MKHHFLKFKKMKALLPLLLITLFSCSKIDLTKKIETNILFYKINQVNLDGKEFSTPIKVVRLSYTDKPPYPPRPQDSCDDCTLPIEIQFFNATYIGQNKVRLDWECPHEDDVSHYIVCKSYDSKDWINSIVVAKQKEVYLYIDKIRR
jgi:hypothetical protein